jgi:hypothetical protein
MSKDAFQLRLWSPVAGQYRVLELVERWEEARPNGHFELAGWYAFWHGDITPRSFDVRGRELGSEGTLFDMFHEAGCVAPSDLVEMMKTASCRDSDDKRTLAEFAERLSELLNDLNAHRQKLRTYFP